MLDNLDLNAIRDENTRELIRRLLNLIEQLSADLREAQAEIQRLRDENNRLKGEQGKPKIKANTAKRPATDHSSEKERHKPRQHSKGSKKAKIQIDRKQGVKVDRAEEAGVFRKCGNPDFGGRLVQPADQGSRQLSGRERCCV